MSRLALLSAVIAAAGAAAVLQFSAPAPTAAHPPEAAGLAKMQLLRDEHDTIRIFLAAQDAKLRAVAAIESEPEPPFAMADAEPEIGASSRALASAVPRKPVRVAKAAAPLSILPPPSPVRLAQLPPPQPSAGPPPPRGAYAWVQDASRLPRRLWAAVGDLMDERGPPVPPRPIPPA